MDHQIERRLSEFLTETAGNGAGLTERWGAEDPLISALEYDSRKIIPGTLYFALPGLHTDGHIYINEAIARGAVVIVHESDIADRQSGIVYLKVRDSRLSMPPIAAAFYGNPSHRLMVAGVTGTEGKSTTVYLIWQLLRLMGKKAGFLSTVYHCDGGEAQQNPEHQTTPEATAVQRILWKMAENGCTYAILEASSHGLSPKTNRLGNVEFDAAVFTNVTHEHLEFHGTWDQYRNDKANLFRTLSSDHGKTDISGADTIPEPFGVINIDDPSAVYFAGVTKRRKISFSVTGKDAVLSIKAVESGAFGNWYNVLITGEKKTIDIRDRLPGSFNVRNVLAALLVVSGLTGVPVSTIAALCPRLQPVKGRMSAINRGQPFNVTVDYAHTPSAFKTIFPPLRTRINSCSGRIISVFGSAGERDIQKRAEQGNIAAQYSDIIILTDEDPRGEDPMDIIAEIARGVYSRESGAFIQDENLFLIPDRPAAIRKAMSLACPGDLVLLLGKGHENSIIYKDHVMPFDETSEAEKAIDELGVIYE